MNQPQNSPYIVRLFFFTMLALAAGILLGATIFDTTPGKFRQLQGYQKIKEVLNLIAKDYVDTVNTEELVDYSIDKMLEKLDPHTVYIPAAQVQVSRSQLESSFDGIGIEFNIFKDTVHIVNVLSNGPSEAAGLQIGDKIVQVEGKPMFDKKADNLTVFKKLKGVKGTQVKIGIMRRNVPGITQFTLTRDRIPQYSVEAAYLIEGSKTGYIKVSNFADKTYEEFKKALQELKKQGMNQLMIDLRDNPGGYLDRAVNMIDELLPDGKLIVYTDGKENRYDQRFKAEKPGIFEKGAVIVLIDEGSASASEIVSGALQDNDRALIVGRRSFGKGLVQMPVTLEDGSEIRLTISRYYTPSGRSIQKAFSRDGKTDAYRSDLKNRLEHGEFYNADSIRFDPKLKFKTSGGRTVYGGGGIMPDVFVALDTTFNTKFYTDLWAKNVVREYAFQYFNEHKATLKPMNFRDFGKNFTVTEAMLQDMLAMAKRDGIKENEKEFQRSAPLIKTQIKAFIASTLYKHDSYGRRNEFIQVMAEDDEIYKKALTLFPEAARLEKSGMVSRK
jgi:carboxyl-terminal processing protease